MPSRILLICGPQLLDGWLSAERRTSALNLIVWAWAWRTGIAPSSLCRASSPSAGDDERRRAGLPAQRAHDGEHAGEGVAAGAVGHQIGRAGERAEHAGAPP